MSLRNAVARATTRVVAGAVAGLLALSSAASPAAALSTAPARPGDFPDPFVLRVGTTHYAYATQVWQGPGLLNVPVVSSPDLRTWSEPIDALPQLPSWAAWGSTWAPSVLVVRGGFVLYYTAQHAAQGIQCVGRATSSTPTGPFVDSTSAPLVCQYDRGGSIDPSPVIDSSGKPVLLWKSDDNARSLPTSIWSQPLTADGLALTGKLTRLLGADRPWEGGVVEGPSMVNRSGKWVLFYGGNDWSSASSGIGYATCSGPAGPCTKRSLDGPWLAGRDGGEGPAGPETFVDAAGRLRLSYHAWVGGVGYETDGAARSLWIDDLVVKNGVPTIP